MNASSKSKLNLTQPITPPPQPDKSIADLWMKGATISPNNFVNKSLSNWSLNVAVGCAHGCRFCYVPDSSTNKLAPSLSTYGVVDPDAQWGKYVLVRKWNGRAFQRSLNKAEQTPRAELKHDGNRAIMLCSTTDPYQTITTADKDSRERVNNQLTRVVRQALRRIRDHSSLNVRILTRSPLVRSDFPLLKTFGDRLLLGMSIPTLDNSLCRIYEPNAPAPSQRLETLKAAAQAGLHTYVAIAPTYAECEEDDIRKTIRAVMEVNPVTIFHEPINIRAENIERIEAHAKTLGKKLTTEVFEGDNWGLYALTQLSLVQRIAEEEGVLDKLHLWPDKDLVNEKRIMSVLQKHYKAKEGDQSPIVAKGELDDECAATLTWIKGWHSRVSEWPGKPKQENWFPPSLPKWLKELAKSNHM